MQQLFFAGHQIFPLSPPSPPSPPPSPPPILLNFVKFNLKYSFHEAVECRKSKTRVIAMTNQKKEKFRISKFPKVPEKATSQKD